MLTTELIESVLVGESMKTAENKLTDEQHSFVHAVNNSEMFARAIGAMTAKIIADFTTGNFKDVMAAVQILTFVGYLIGKAEAAAQQGTQPVKETASAGTIN